MLQCINFNTLSFLNRFKMGYLFHWKPTDIKLETLVYVFIQNYINCVVSFSLNLEKKWSLFKPEMLHNTSYIMQCYKITNVTFLQFMSIFKHHEITVFCCTCWIMTQYPTIGKKRSYSYGIQIAFTHFLKR